MNLFEEHRDRLATRKALIGVIGLGYVGLPLAAASARAGYDVLGFDIDPAKPEQLNTGRSYIDAVSSDELGQHIASGRFAATVEFDRLADCDVIVICVPTPLSKQREPDLSFVEDTARSIAGRLRKGQLVVLESTSYPGTTDECVKPILEAGGLVSGRDFWIGYSPEREDPGNPSFHTSTIPKVVAGDGAEAAELVQLFYSAVVERVVPVSSPATAEAVKITENIYRAVNIALVNELKVIFDSMGIDVWEVIDAAATKPFGFTPFYPGPGLGGHCIPIDPFYLTWKAREFGVSTRFIELAGEINSFMPQYVQARLERALDERLRKSLGASRLLVIGVSYKKNIADVRESPALRLIELLEERGAAVEFHDPHVAEIPMTREHRSLAGRRSIELDDKAVAAVDAVVILTDHDAIDYAAIAGKARLIVDTRNALRRRSLSSDALVLA